MKEQYSGYILLNGAQNLHKIVSISSPYSTLTYIQTKTNFTSYYATQGIHIFINVNEWNCVCIKLLTELLCGTLLLYNEILCTTDCVITM